MSWIKVSSLFLLSFSFLLNLSYNILSSSSHRALFSTSSSDPHLYDSSLSSTFSLSSNDHFHLSYLDKTKLTGQFCSDVLSFGSSSPSSSSSSTSAADPDFVAHHDPFISHSHLNILDINSSTPHLTTFGCLHTSFQSSFYTNSIHGILGLSFPSQQYPTMNLLTTIFPSQSQRIFTLILFPNSSNGLLQIGGFDSTKSHLWSPSLHTSSIILFSKSITIPVLNDCSSTFSNTKERFCPFRNYRIGIQKVRYGN
jgi:hypothetical protein